MLTIMAQQIIGSYLNNKENLLVGTEIQQQLSLVPSSQQEFWAEEALIMEELSNIYRRMEEFETFSTTSTNWDGGPTTAGEWDLASLAGTPPPSRNETPPASPDPSISPEANVLEWLDAIPDSQAFRQLQTVNTLRRL